MKYPYSKLNNVQRNYAVKNLLFLYLENFTQKGSLRPNSFQWMLIFNPLINFGSHEKYTNENFMFAKKVN